MKKKNRGTRIKAAIYAIIISFAVISFWRGIWGLQEIYFFPSNLNLSLWASVTIGVAILFFTRHLIKELI